MVAYAEDGTRLIAGYIPKTSLSCVGIAFYGLLAAVFWARFFLQGRHKYMLTLCIGTTTMALGFAVRIGLTSNPGSMGVYIVMTLFTLLSPCAFLANDYIILPRLVAWLDAEEQLFIRPSRVVRIFVWSDVFTFWLQAGGGGLSAARDSPSLQKIGLYVALVGLILQCLSFMTFIGLAVVFGRRIKKTSKWTKTPNNAQGYTVSLWWKEDWRSIYFAILWTSIGIMVRCIFRVVEYAQGFDGSLRNAEWAFYALDALPLFLALSVWTVIWPPAILTDHKQYHSNMGDSGTAVLNNSTSSHIPLTTRSTPQWNYEETKQVPRQYA
ncbi:uncharacterized protein IL334_000400 [Kwoniella shivajii]|uniref:RTA1-domain-containing protein n=1 Tax=Kwoniella shivajii TaxID=564305 RepID=A0ABZ1CPE5_9TREE|nr:hypothetical protein IL334_000400 [Kwoniella shivajii]